MNHQKLFAGSEIMVLAVRNILDENNISYIIRDDIEAGISAGFGTADKAVNVFVEAKDLLKAQQLLKENDLVD